MAGKYHISHYNEKVGTVRAAEILGYSAQALAQARVTGKLSGRQGPNYHKISDRKLVYIIGELKDWHDAGFYL